MFDNKKTEKLMLEWNLLETTAHEGTELNIHLCVRHVMAQVHGLNCLKTLHTA